MRSLILVFFFLLFTFPPGFLHAEQETISAQEELVLTEDANLRKGPGASFAIMNALRKGTKVRIIYQVGEWTRVELPNSGQSGWIHLPPAEDPPTEPSLPPVPAKTIAPVPMKESKLPAKKTVDQVRPRQLVAVIDIQQVINESQRGRAARQKYEDLRRSGRENMNQAEETIISAVIVEIRAVVETYARKHGFTHVINKNAGSIFYHDGSFNITADIISEYDRQAALPQQQTP